MPRTATSEDLKDDAFEMREEVPRTRIGRVFSRIISRRRKPRGQDFYELSRDSSHPGTGSVSQQYASHASHAELDRNGLTSAGGARNWRNQSTDGLTAYQRAIQKLDREAMGPAPPHAPPARNSLHGITPEDSGHPPQGPSPPASAPYNQLQYSSLPSMPSPATTRLSTRPDRRFDVPSPITIAPQQLASAPLVNNSSNPDSTFISYSPYQYHTPHTVSPLPTGDVGPVSRHGPPSSPSSESVQSSRASRSPASLSSLSRNNSAAKPIESRSLPPPTPTYHQSQRAPIDTENIVCLGPMPDNMQFPSSSNNHFRSQTQQNPRSPPMLVIPNGQQRSPPASPSSPPSPVTQDLFLHDQSPLAPYQSPVKSVFTRELSLHSDRPGTESSFREADRRGSTDSLGSNFTVEEEARIQAQIVKNLSMLGQERVGGEGDIVHVPQPSPRRYSWEDV
ncbi:hypothetical protein KVR01_003423 [Diaporthe batatas]|uniref:uncharacterized protein n=1 Tax=Diaporthe batatas TaxID=748121 RepID=UPI001D0539DA|nr:uncharacterized protein KVR01_003423 [Diaporthe batatas]KAG8167734.1 hypothetical protein KVR01_003423 [Diaporthe batatas]